MPTESPFTFLDPGDPTDGDVRLALVDRQPADASVWREPAYLFDIVVRRTGERVGRVSLRVGHGEWTVRYNGHLGYAVDEPHRGRRYAERAARLVLPLAARHGLAELWATCGPENVASQRTIERLGGQYVETVDVPPDFPLPAGAVRQKMRYRLVVPALCPAPTLNYARPVPANPMLSPEVARRLMVLATAVAAFAVAILFTGIAGFDGFSRSTDMQVVTGAAALLALVWTVAWRMRLIRGSRWWADPIAFAACGTVAVVAVYVQVGWLMNDPNFPRSRWRADLIRPSLVAAGAVAAFGLAVAFRAASRRIGPGTISAGDDRRDSDADAAGR